MKRAKVKLSRTDEKRITLDWQSKFPTFAIYEPMWLLKRCGPFLVGICLNRDSSGLMYHPTFHLHFLGNFLIIRTPSLTAPIAVQAKSGGPDYLTLSDHIGRFEVVANQLCRQVAAIFDNDRVLSCDDFVRLYRDFERTPLGNRQRLLLYTDQILLLVLCDRCEDATKLLNLAITDKEHSFRFGNFRGIDDYQVVMNHAIVNPDVIRNDIIRQLKMLRAEELPDYGMVC
jgi:hypothetical protein